MPVQCRRPGFVFDRRSPGCRRKGRPKARVGPVYTRCHTGDRVLTERTQGQLTAAGSAGTPPTAVTTRRAARVVRAYRTRSSGTRFLDCDTRSELRERRLARGYLSEVGSGVSRRPGPARSRPRSAGRVYRNWPALKSAAGRCVVNCIGVGPERRGAAAAPGAAGRCSRPADLKNGQSVKLRCGRRSGCSREACASPRGREKLLRPGELLQHYIQI